MKQFLHFKSSVGRRLICVEDVIEVIPMVFLQREEADAANENFCGLLNFRGKIVPVFNLSAYDEEACLNHERFLVVSRTNLGQVAILAYEVDYLLDINENDIAMVKSKSGMPFNVAKVNDEVVRIVLPEEFLS